jgi:hypothetical protein
VDVAQAASDLVPFAVLIVVAFAAFGFAVWFGLRVIAPRLGRAVDRAESEDESGP